MAERKKTSDGDKKESRYKLALAGLKTEEERPDITITATDRDLKVIHVSQVDSQGTFDLPPNILKSAHRIFVGPRSDQENAVAAEDVLRYRTSDFVKLLDAGSINISRRVWEKWYFFIRCVSGKVRLCRRRPWWYYELFTLAATPQLELQRPTPNIGTAVSLRKSAAMLRPTASSSISELIYFPFRCQTICNGTVEVYRRRCCCRPWIFDDIRLPELVLELEDIVREIPDFPFPPDPNPPDPPYAIEKAFFKDGALDERAVNARQDLAAIRALPKAEIADYINGRPYLLCRRTCTTPVKVGQGSINPDGKFNICWFGGLDLLPFRCHYEYAYIVKQKFGFFTITIYNGVTANIWYDYDDEPTLTSYSPFAFACRDNGDPGDGAYVFLDLIGDTESWNLKTPNADGWDSVASPAYNDGLAFPSASPAAAVGANLNRNWGRTLKLNYKFSEDLRLLGAKYYRISVTEADANGDPAVDSMGDPKPRYYLPAPPEWEKSVPDGMGGADIVPQALGPNSVGGQNSLCLIPYDNGPAPNGGDWNAGQYHGYLNTNDPDWSDPTKRHLVTIEIFDAAGKRLRPNGTPATGQPGAEGTANFTYRRRFQDLGPTANVPFGALTHMFWWDNRPVVADVVNLNLGTSASISECQFLTGTKDSTFGIGYRAYHPNEMFQLNHSISWRRGLGAGTGVLLPTSSANVGVEPPLGSPVGNSPTNTFGQMLDIVSDPNRKKCAFTVFLSIRGKAFDGESLATPDVTDSAAFALEIS